MAKRPSLIAKRVKKPRVTRNEAYLINFKYLGDEPDFKGELSNADYGKALNWYNYMCTTADAREYITDYLKANNRKDDLKTFKRVPDAWVSTTLAWVCRMLTRGYTLPGNPKSYIDERLKECLFKAKAEEPDADKVDVYRPSIQDRMREKQSEIIGDIEAMIDSGEPFSLYDWLKGREIPATYAGAIAGYYSPIAQELAEALEGIDPQLKEGYSHLTKKQLRERCEMFQGMVSDAERYGNVAKKTKAPRKPRAVSMEKRLKNFKYQKEDGTFKVASINPEKVIGAQELWTFNTKYKIVTVFRAIDRGGLQIERSSIKNYDEKTSLSKGCGRQAEKVVDKIQNGGKIVLKKLMDELKTDKQLQFRINENTILMKVVT
jgi:uncharacterized protein YehS (DUF1456 family)